MDAANHGRLAEPLQLTRHLFETTTVNLVASDAQSRSISQATQVKLPLTFFVNADAFFDQLGLEPDIEIPAVAGEFYLKNIAAFEFKLKTDGFEQPGDTNFAFIVPEPAFEDTQVIVELLRRSILTPRFVACVLMVDFCNPLSSVSRQELLQYVPRDVRIQNGDSDLVSQFVTNVQTALGTPAGSVANSPQQQFVDHWQSGDNWKPTFERRIENYFVAIEQNLQSQRGYDAYVRLAESRRREFRRRPLSEFDLTLPVTNIPNDAPALQMFEDASVGPN